MCGQVIKTYTPTFVYGNDAVLEFGDCAHQEAPDNVAIVINTKDKYLIIKVAQI